MAQVIFYVCFDDFLVNWISFFFCRHVHAVVVFSTRFFCSTHLLFMWLKEELSRVNSIAVYSHTRMYGTRTAEPSLPNVLAQNMSTYPLHSSLFASFNALKCQDTLSTATDFFCSHRQKRRWIVCFVKSWNSFEHRFPCVASQLIFLSHIHYMVNF